MRPHLSDAEVGLQPTHTTGNGPMRQQKAVMLGISPGRMMGFAPELQDLLGFRTHKGPGHVFAQDPRLETQRHSGDVAAEAPYLGRRNTLHDDRTARPSA